MYVTVYKVDTGEIVLTANLAANEIPMNVGVGEAYIEGTYDGRTTRIINGTPIDYEPVFDAVGFARQFRQGFLADCDWTQAADSPLSAAAKSAWADYRQALRDFPATIATAMQTQTIKLRDVERLIPTPPSE